MNSLFGIEKEQPSEKVTTDYVKTFKQILKSLRDSSDNVFFYLHYQSMLNVIDGKLKLSKNDSIYIKATIPIFSDTSLKENAAEISSYLDRSRPVIIGWYSAYDKEVSFSLLTLPKDWDPEKSYPLYVELHGLWNVCDDPINYMTYNYRNGPSTTFAYEDGYRLLPWGRGNMWYQGISETDIGDAVEYFENLVKVDPAREYLTGHSMGGFGAWYLAGKSADKWAAIGIHAGALGYGDNTLYDQQIKNLSEMPTYFVVGTNDGFYNVNLEAADTLRSLGNQNVEFVTFNGGHVYQNKNVENMYLWLRQFKNRSHSGLLESEKNRVNTLFFYPNPVQSETSIHVNLEKPGPVQLYLYDNAGRKAATILNRNLVKGESIISWNRGRLPSGIYLYSFIIDQYTMNGKLVIY
jgi:dienelactone hydrolase